MKCWYHAPEKCDTVEDVLDHDKGGHCWACMSTTPGHSEMAPTKLGTGGISFKDQMRAEKLWRRRNDRNKPKSIFDKLATEAKRSNRLPGSSSVTMMKNGPIRFRRERYNG